MPPLSSLACAVLLLAGAGCGGPGGQDGGRPPIPASLPGPAGAERAAMTDDKLEGQILHDGRAVHDLAALRFADYEPGGRPPWILATRAPGPRSGSATIPGGYIEAETGKLVVPEGAMTVLVKEGTWKALSSSPPGAHPASGSY